MKTILTLLFALCVVGASAQYTTVTNTSGTVTYGSHAVTVTGGGSASSYSVWCGAGPYWIGAGSGSTPVPGYYRFQFAPAVTAFRVEVTAANTGESITVAVNGSHYSLVAANVFSYAGTCGSGAFGLSGDTLLCTSGGGSGANAGINVWSCGGITECVIATNGLQNGSVFRFKFSDTVSCGASNNGPLCLGDTLKLFANGASSSTYAWSGPGGFTSTDQNPIIIGASYADTGVYRVIGNGTDTSYTRFVIKQGPNISASSNSPICVGSTLLLTSGPDSVGQTYSWVGPNSFTSTAQNPSITSTPLIDSGFYTVVATWNGCKDTATVHVVVSPPVPVHLGNDTSVCVGSSVTFSSSDPYTAPSYLWSTSATGPTLTTSTPGTYWLRVTVSGCPGYDTVVLTTRPYPLVNLGIDTAFCAGGSFTLNPTPAAGETYLWSTGATTGSLVVTTPGTYWLAADSNACISRDTVQIIEKPVPVVDLGADISVCAGVPVTLSSSITYSAPIFSWVTGSGASSISPTTSGTYWLNVTVRGCTGRDTVNVEFRRHPVANLGRDTSFCYGGTYTLNALAGEDAYLWSTGATTSSITVTTGGTYWLSVDSVGCNSKDTINIIQVPSFAVHLGPDTTICTLTTVNLQSSDTYPSLATYQWNTGSTAPVLTASASGTYILAVNQLGCVERDTIDVTIKYDSVHIVNNDTAICRGKSVQVVTTTHEIGGTYTYQWLPTTGIPFSTVPNAYITPDTTAMYIIQALTAGCPPITDSFSIDVQPNPISVYVGGNRFLCEFDTLHIDASVSPAWYTHYSYSWAPAADLDYSTTKTVVFSGHTTTKLILTVTTPAGCTGKDSTTVILTAGNFATITPDQQLCPGDSVVLTAAGGTSYHWYPWLYTSDSLAASVMVHPVGSVQYKVVVTESHGCTDTVSTLITVHPAALISIDDSVKLFPGESIHLSPLTNCNTFQWYPPAGLNSDRVSDPVAMPEVNTKYFVFGTTADGCHAMDSIDVIVNEESIVAMPNAFTPGNGINGSLKILKRGVASINYYRVYNRWGNVVFETKDIDEGWQGDYKGAPQPLGVYVYDIQAVSNTGKLVNLRGNVTLLR